VKVTTPTKANPSDSPAKKRRMRRRFRRRAGIEPIIGHLKTDHRLGQNYLSGEESPQINAYLAAAGWNLKKWMEQWVRDGKKLHHFAWSILTGRYHHQSILSS
jgi:IS5 family transposase